MDLLTPKDFASLVNSKSILLDTSVFIDHTKHPVEFKRLFSLLRENNVELLTLEFVKMEFLKGIRDTQEYKEREILIDTNINAYLPVSEKIIDSSLSLITQYKQSGSATSVVDLILAGAVMAHKSSLLLLTKNTTDFPSDIFKLHSYFHLVHKRGIHLYAIYKYEK